MDSVLIISNASLALDSVVQDHDLGVMSNWLSIASGWEFKKESNKIPADFPSLCRILSLHQLGSSPNKLPPDDPMYPPNNPLLRRQLAIRLFNAVVSFDAFLSYHRAQFRGEQLAYFFGDGKVWAQFEAEPSIRNLQYRRDPELWRWRPCA